MSRARGLPPALGLAAIVAGAALLRLRLLAVPLERDEGEYAYMAQLILRGEVPYLAAHHAKLPGVYYAYAAILGVFGETDVGIRLGLLVVHAASAVLLYRLGRRLLDATAGLGAAAAFVVLSLSASMGGTAANAEHFVVLPLLGGLLLLADGRPDPHARRAAAAGLLLGVAVLMKQHAAAFVAAGALQAALAPAGGRRGRAARALAVAVAALVPFALLCAALAAAGAFAPFWFWTVTYAREYAAMVPAGDALAALRTQAVRIAAAAPALWALAAVGATAPLWDVPARRAAAWLALLAAGSAAAVATGLRFSDHYFLLLVPAAALLAGAAASALARRVPLLAPAAVGAAVLATLAQERRLLFELPPAAVARAVNGSNPFPEAVVIGEWLRARAAPDDRIGVIGSEPEIYFYARRRAATTYLYTYPLMEPHPFARRMQEDMIAQLERARPRFLVLVNVDTSWSRRPDSSTRLLDWAAATVDRDYRPVGLAEIVPGRDTTYRWEAAAAVPPRAAAFVATFERRS